MIIFEARDLVKYFGGLSAVNGVGFQVEKGEIFGLIGPNGSGKTTIFNLINHYFPLTSGDIFLTGQKITGLSPHKICKLGIARTFQKANPLARMTVLLVEQNVKQTLTICHRAYVLENGRIVLEGTGEELLNNPQVKEAYLGI